MVSWRFRPRPSPAEVAEREEMKAEAERQRHEAWDILDDAKRAAELARRTRQRDNYTAALDRLFRGRRT